MAHINFGKTEHGPSVADEWLAATAAATQFAGRIADRPELAVKLGPGFAAQAGTAQFSPALLEIEVDTDLFLAGVDPEDVKPQDALFRARNAMFVGALVHEGAHARYSQWVPRDLMEFQQRKVDVLVALEESRIEKRILARFARFKFAVASIVFDVLGKDFKVSDSPYGASIGAALTLARVDAGVLTRSEAKPFRDIIGTVLADDVLDVLSALWREYQDLPFSKWEPLPLEEMDSIATRWIEALGMDAEDEGMEGMVCEFAMPEGGEDGEGGEGGAEGAGEGSEGEEGGSGSGSLSEALKGAAKDAAHGKDMEAAEKVGDVKAKRRAAQREADADRKRKGKDAAKDAFGDPADAKDGKKSGFAHVGSSEVRWDAPTERERAAGMRLSSLLQRVAYEDRRVAKVRQEVPGGRLHGRGAVQRAAQKAAGQRPVAEPWEVKKRTHVDEPKMRVGVMLDVSGSMHAQAKIAGSLAYAVGNAVSRVDGDFGMTLFGSDVLGIIKPGQRIDKAPRVSTSCGWEYFSKGFHALDSVLDLVDGDGLRVLVLISDGVFVQGGEQKAANAIIPMLAAKGVVILHVDIDNELERGRFSHYEPAHHSPFPPVVISRATDPVDAASSLGEHLVGLVKKFKAGGRAA